MCRFLLMTSPGVRTRAGRAILDSAHPRPALIRLTIGVLCSFALPVSMVQASEPNTGYYFCSRRWPVLDGPAIRRVLLQCIANPVLMVVRHVLTNEAPQMAFTQRDDMVEKLAAATAHPPFGESVL